MKAPRRRLEAVKRRVFSSGEEDASQPPPKKVKKSCSESIEIMEDAALLEAASLRAISSGEGTSVEASGTAVDDVNIDIADVTGEAAAAEVAAAEAEESATNEAVAPSQPGPWGWNRELLFLMEPWQQAEWHRQERWLRHVARTAESRKRRGVFSSGEEEAPQPPPKKRKPSGGENIEIMEDAAPVEAASLRAIASCEGTATEDLATAVDDIDIAAAAEVVAAEAEPWQQAELQRQERWLRDAARRAESRKRRGERGFSLYNWRPTVRDGKLCFEGERFVGGQCLPHVTSPLERVTQHDAYLIVLEDGETCHLRGEVAQCTIPDHIRRKFMGGVPRYWRGALAQLLEVRQSTPNGQYRRGPYNLRPRK